MLRLKHSLPPIIPTRTPDVIFVNARHPGCYCSRDYHKQYEQAGFISLTNKATLDHHFRAFLRKETKNGLGCASLSQSLLSALIYNKTTKIQLHFRQI